MGPSPEAIVSLANLRRNGPRSGLSSEASDKIGFGLSGWGFLERRSGDGLDREGEGEGGFLGSGDGVLEIPGSDLWDWVWVWVSGTEIRSGGASGGVLTETKPGIVEDEEDDENVCELFLLKQRK